MSKTPSGGVGSGGNVNSLGGSGQSGFAFSGAFSDQDGGNGGDSAFSGGGAGASTSGGDDGQSGSGGGGLTTDNGAGTVTGKNGGNGLVAVRCYV